MTNAAQPRVPSDTKLDRAARWDATYKARGVGGVSWFQTEPAVSLDLIDAIGLARDAAID